MNATLPTPHHGPSTAAEYRRWLGTLDDDELSILLTARPDAAVPLPPSIDSLGTRLLLRSSVTRALARCDAAELATLEKLGVQGAELRDVARNELQAPATAEAADSLLAKGLLYETEAGFLRLPLEILPALPSDFTLLTQYESSTGSLDELNEQERSILNTLIANGGTGSTRDAAPDADPSRPVPQLIARGLLHRVDSHTVRLPRAVRAMLRGEPVSPIPLEPSGRLMTATELVAHQPGPSAATNEAGTAAGLEVVRSVERLIDYLGASPIPLLKDKTVGVRPVAALAKGIGTASDEAVRLIALAFHARLVGRGEPKGGPEGNFLAPTEQALRWSDQELGHKWADLLEAWHTSPWAAWESSRALDQDSSRERLVTDRGHILDVYARAESPLSPEEFLSELHFAHPLFASYSKRETIEQLRAEAEWIGAVAKGQATAVAHSAEAALALTPQAVHQFIAQADMTILAPGPLEPEIQRRLESLAELESPGLASVYRITNQSIRRGMDAGLSGEEITGFLSEHCIGELPQTISYLVKDVARSHGTLRSGPAMAYLRSADESLLAAAVTAVPILRQLAPTVAITTEPLHVLLAALREAGYSPAAEDASGASIDARPEPALLPTPRPRPGRTTAEPDIAGAVAAIRAGKAPRNAPSSDAAPDLDLLRTAARSGRPVIIGYADKNGNLKHATATPLSVAGGQLDATVSGRPVRFPLQRITSVALQ